MNDFRSQMGDVHSKLKVHWLWQYYTGERNVKRSLRRYRVTHEDLVAEALKCPPVRPGLNVTDFSSWVYKLYITRSSSDSALKGIFAETAIEKKRIAASQFLSDYMVSDWVPEYRGLTESFEPALQISSLRISGRPLLGKPDLVFRHRRTREIVILEIKASNADVPGDGWPNLRAQLWAYSQIDRFADAPRIHLASQVWKECPPGEYVLSAPIVFDHLDREFNENNAQLFAIYEGRTT